LSFETKGPCWIGLGSYEPRGGIVQSVMGYASRHRGLVIVAALVVVFFVLPVVAYQLATVH